MRVTSMVAGLALVLAACGGEKPADGAMTSDGAAPAATETPSATTGATHDVDMTFENNEYKFVPAEFSAKPGDVIRFHNKMGARTTCTSGLTASRLAPRPRSRSIARCRRWCPSCSLPRARS